MSQPVFSLRLPLKLILLLLSNLFIICCSYVDTPNKLDQMMSLSNESSSDSEDDYDDIDQPTTFINFMMQPVYIFEPNIDPYICHRGNVGLNQVIHNRHIYCTLETTLTNDRKRVIQEAADYAMSYCNKYFMVKDVQVNFPNQTKLRSGVKNISINANENTNFIGFILARSHGPGTGKLAYTYSHWAQDNIPHIFVITFNVSILRDHYPIPEIKKHMILFTMLHEIIHGIGFTQRWLNFDNFLIGTKDVFMVTSPKVKDLVQKHFNCRTLQGGHLIYITSSHWDSLFYPEELMNSVYYPGRIATSLTFAALEDFRHYRVIIPGTQLTVGKNTGCDFVQHFNLEKIPNRCYPNKKHSNRCSKDGLVCQDCTQVEGDIYRWKNDMLCSPGIDCKSLQANFFPSCIKNNMMLFKNKRHDYIKFKHDFACYNIYCTGPRNYITQIGSFYYPCKVGKTFKVHNYYGMYKCDEHMDVCLKYDKSHKNDWTVLNSVTPRKVRYGDVITIKGKHFRRIRQPVSICIEKLHCKIVAISNKVIKCKITHNKCKIKDNYVEDKQKGKSIAKRLKMNLLYVDEEKEQGNALINAFQLLKPKDKKNDIKEEKERQKAEERQKLGPGNRRPSTLSENVAGPSAGPSGHNRPGTIPPPKSRPINLLPPKSGPISLPPPKSGPINLPPPKKSGGNSSPPKR